MRRIKLWTASNQASPVTMLACGRCGGELYSRSQGGVVVEACAYCDGALVDQRNVVPLLTAQAADLDPEWEQRQMRPVPDRGAGVSCPHCGDEMNNHGYAGSRFVRIDSCASCEVVWFDANEIEAATEIYARGAMRRSA